MHKPNVSTETTQKSLPKCIHFYPITRLVILIVLAIVYIMIAFNLSPDYAPDERMRYQIPEYIFAHGKLPIGNETELINNLYGFSYAFRPYLASLIALAFMSFASLFGARGHGLIIASRMVSVASALIAVALMFAISDRITGSKKKGTIAGILLGFLPQLSFIAGYLNNDAFALM